MSETEEELVAKISALGEEIKAAKAAGKPKEEWNGTLQEMLSLKAKVKELFGKDMGPAKKEKKGPAGQQQQQQQQQQQASEKNKEKNAAKAKAKAEKEAKKAAQRAEREQREQDKIGRLAGVGQENFGDAPMIQSQSITEKVWTPIEQLKPGLAGQTVLVRGHLRKVRGTGKGVFILVRSTFYSVQGLAWESKEVSKAMIKYIVGLPLESVVDMKGTIQIPDQPVDSATQKMVEVAIQSLHCVSKPKQALPFQMDDACRQESPESSTSQGQPLGKETLDLNALLADKPYVGGWNFSSADVDMFAKLEGPPNAGMAPHAFRWYLHVADLQGIKLMPSTMLQKAEQQAKESADTTKDESKLARVGKDTRLDYRWLDLRTPAHQAIFRIESMVGCLFRECLLKKGFVEVHTPKLIGGASEGGSEVFKLDYFGQPACLAMSPQLHKQIAAACSGFERVFTTGPVFRAENSNTPRHLCEFTGLDLEMVINEHYDEVLQVFSDLFIHIFDGINQRCKAELEMVREQYPFEDFQYLRPTLKLTYAEGCKLLREAGAQQSEYEDISTENEKKLGEIVKEKYKTDFFFMDKYPLSVRPFYTMPDPKNPKLSNSYDFFMRGNEILSGAQRIHEPELIEERAKAWEIPLNDIESYVDSFRHGALPHGGGGIGLERVIMLFLGLPSVRKTAWFPRDPKRISP